MINNQLKTYDAPYGLPLQNDYCLRVRPVGTTEWKIVPIFQVKVDMHDVRLSSLAWFEFEGEVEVEVSGPFYICEAVIRPLSKDIRSSCDTKRVTFTLDQPANLSIELNGERYHNLHLFTYSIENGPKEDGRELIKIDGNPKGASFLSLAGLLKKAKQVGKDVTQVTFSLGAGTYFVEECMLHLLSGMHIYLEPNTVIVGAIVCDHVEDVRVFGRGIIYQADFLRFNGINGVRISHAKKISIEDMIFINPPHYTIHVGGSEDITLKNIKSFSCQGWSDGIDIMSSKKILVDGGFLRTSDDCIAVYGSRWDYYGDSYDIVVKNMTLWADVAHPIMMGVHGDHQNKGDIIHDVLFQNIDILEHNEPQAGYLGCIAINAGDKNTIEDIIYKDIRIEKFRHGKVIDIQVRWNKDYNPFPGKRISRVIIENLTYDGDGEVTSEISGYSEAFQVSDIQIINYKRNGKTCQNLKDANIHVGLYASNITIK